jgi:hypothetical protein
MIINSHIMFIIYNVHFDSSQIVSDVLMSPDETSAYPQYVYPHAITTSSCSRSPGATRAGGCTYTRGQEQVARVPGATLWPIS